jgi:translation initiation factor IF-3
VHAVRLLIFIGVKRREAISDKSNNHRINGDIRAQSVRLVGEDSGPKVVSLEDALAEARKLDLDLVEISANQDPPVVKIIDYSKFKFEQAKKAKEAKKKQKIIHVKEVKLRPAIDSHDFEHKIKRAKEFLEKGDKVKFTLMFRGREMAHTELGFEVMKKVRAMLIEMAQVEKEPSQEGRNITMIMSVKAAK